MSINESAREQSAQKRQDIDHQEENLLSRAEENLEKSDTNDLAEEARELAAEQRHHEEHVHDTLLERAEEQISEG
ncbi:hypothetical protein L3556_05975 [Candidatus Synechococcus calcipolaris G9]|uniref:Uncharacterized protein n=1 Tax=Candidatus Synechococcus calcipolaris G9 TaxID=1497997 RepID=A0ABT6EXL3_9SYNE|nr:hypothetical protein [Candidatus Synechococcus calcipolaris]MDG2990482.1 hypothetical protein [Candidatus Synechococcus calcipolaris G9]